jgi:hypothetical protein
MNDDLLEDKATQLMMEYFIGIDIMSNDLIFNKIKSLCIQIVLLKKEVAKLGMITSEYPILFNKLDEHFKYYDKLSDKKWENIQIESLKLHSIIFSHSEHNCNQGWRIQHSIQDIMNGCGSLLKKEYLAIKEQNSG